MLKPIVPGFVARLEAQLGGAPLGWADARISPREDWLAIGEPKPLVAAPTDAQLAGLRPLPSIIPVVDGKPQIAEPTKPEIAYDDFGKLDLRVGKILSAERVPKADKLLKLSVDLGEPEPRTIAAGIAEAYADPQTLVGKNVVVVANLAPRTIRGITSRGMLLAAHGGAKELGVVEAAADVAPGSKVS
jgi:methionyl-tRNA synthetase